ncbi:MAG: hypothetical protein ACJAUV_002203 [Flavobacteriales bacterium]|jgi:uncharacterized protein (DUF58 family)
MIEKEHLVQFGSLELLAKQVVKGFITGMHKSPFHGFSVEFAEHRLYNTGDSIKHVDWKLFARSDKLFVKRYEEETNLRAQIILDVSSSMYYPNDKDSISKLQYAVYAIASLTELLKKQRDAVGLSLFQNEVKEHLPAKLSNTHLHQIFSLLEQTVEQNIPNKKSDLIGSLHEIAERIPKRSLIILFSDLMDDTRDMEELVLALQHLKHSKHEVIVFDVFDGKKELNLDLGNHPYEFIDLESGSRIKAFPSEIKEAYKKALGGYKTELALRCQQLHIDFMPLDIQMPLDEVLVSYLIKRSRMK